LKKAAVVWLAAIGIAAGYLALLVWMDKSARDSRELVSRLSVPVLATVPLLTAKETH
jgi:capsular polysaccharide biosynthesis protein